MTPPSESLCFVPDTTPSERADAILYYLQDRLQGYPFDPKIDSAFVEELIADFPRLDILEQIKIWRWYYNGRPPMQRQPRAALRRWLARAQR